MTAGVTGWSVGVTGGVTAFALRRDSGDYRVTLGSRGSDWAGVTRCVTGMAR